MSSSLAPGKGRCSPRGENKTLKQLMGRGAPKHTGPSPARPPAARRAWERQSLTAGAAALPQGTPVTTQRRSGRPGHTGAWRLWPRKWEFPPEERAGQQGSLADRVRQPTRGSRSDMRSAVQLHTPALSSLAVEGQCTHYGENIRSIRIQRRVQNPPPSGHP